MVVLAIALLFAQAMADLALPDYMSRIVNNGIQQSGIENAIPEIILEEDFPHFMLFMEDQDAETISNIYLLISPTNPTYEDYGLDTSSGSIYILNPDAVFDSDQVESIMSRTLLAISGIETMQDNAPSEGLSFNGMEMPLDDSIYDMLENIPTTQRIQMFEENSAQFSVMGETMVSQVASQALGKYYEDIGIDLAERQRQYILKIGAIMLIVTILGAIASISVGYISAKTAAGVGRNLRESIFRKIESFSNYEFDTFSTASLITRSTNDVTQIQTLLVMLIRIIFYAPIMGVGGIIKAMEKSTSMSWIIALAVALLITMIVVIFKIAMPKFKLVQKLIDRLNMVMRENLTGMMVIRAFNTQKFEENRFDQANEELTATNLFVNRIMVFMSPAMMLIMNGTSLLIVWVGAHQIENAAMQVGDMMAFMQYALQIIFAFLMLSMMFIMVPRAIVSAQRISEVLSTEASIVDPLNPTPPLPNGTGHVEFKNVGFRFQGAEDALLKDISFTSKPGETTAIIGATGSGKTTLINLLPRFYDVTEGSILIDGIDIRDMKMTDVREIIGYIPQKASLFSGTIESNLRYGREYATEEEILDAIDVAQGTDIVNEKEAGLKAKISQSGSNVSGGQKQRLSIARALIKNPKILIIDDSFSALDFKTDANLRKALRNRTSRSTLLLVAQRIATIQHADQIIVLEEGRICGIGSHEYLMDQCETYREIALSQLSAEELS
jgi:ATP-binding cassette subfamily B protein